MKRTILITLILVICTFVFAEVQLERASRNPIPQNSRSRTEVIAYQETFEEGAVDWTFSSSIAANQLWHIAEVADTPSPIFAMVNQNTTSTYNINMLNYLISPAITLPLSGAIKADFMMKGDFADAHYPGGTIAQMDYWGWQISTNNGSTWRNMSNPYTTAAGSVFIDAPPEWGFVTESYSALNGLISDYAGQTVKFRIYFRSDNDTPDGTGIMIDNFTIYNDVFIPSPTSLTGSVVEQNVQLSWTAPPSGMSAETITSTNSAWTSFVSDAEAYAMKITNPTNEPLQLHGVNFMLYRQGNASITGAPTVHVYEDTDGMPGTELVAVAGVTNITNNVWKTVDITSHNIMIPANGTIFVGISNIEDGGTSGQGLLCDSTSVTANSYAMFQGAWDVLSAGYEGLKNCGLAGVYWVDDPFAPLVTGFKVYRTLNPTAEYALIGTIDNATTLIYTDEDPVAGSVNYYKVTAMFGVYESDPSEVFSIDLIGLLYTEILTDDGTSNQTFNVGSTNYMATKFETEPGAEIHYLKVFINTVGSTPMITSIYNPDGVGGAPGNQFVLQFTTAINQLTTGWNSVPLPAANIITDADGVFYVAIREFTNSSVYSLDTDNSGDSWKKIGTAAWAPIAEGNVMIRALVSWAPDANEDLVEIAPVSNLTNYPNPFNRMTNISFDVQKSGMASLKVYNLKGQLVNTISSGNVAKGTNNFTWDGTDSKGKSVSLGVYFCQLESAGQTITKKIIRVK